jgi:hypothetical protein
MKAKKDKRQETGTKSKQSIANKNVQIAKCGSALTGKQKQKKSS